MHLDAVEHNDEIVFMHNVKSGAANKSYGLQVAKLAGLPQSVLNDARERLQALEASDQSGVTSKNIPTPNTPEPKMQMGLFESTPGALDSYMENLDINDVSPRQALEHLYKMADLIK